MNENIVFTYGTLMSDRVLQEVLGRVPKRLTAQLCGYERHPIKGQCYPAVIRSNDQNKVVSGKILVEISNLELKAFDSFEDPAYERRKVDVKTESGSILRARVWARSDCNNADLVFDKDWNYEHFVKYNEEWYIQRCKQWARQYYQNCIPTNDKQ